MTSGQISLRGVRVHNLKNVDLDIPHRSLVAICGLSGSGKTSLALDTLYAEGQRRYIESFSAYTRQFLEPFQKPNADRIDGIPPAIAVTRQHTSRSRRSTVATTTEVIDYLRLLYARIGRIVCHGCGQTVTADSPEIVAKRITALLADRQRLMVAFPVSWDASEGNAALVRSLREDGFIRVVVGPQMIDLASERAAADLQHTQPDDATAQVIVDRLTAGQCDLGRLIESLETAMTQGRGSCAVLVERTDRAARAEADSVTINGQVWFRYVFSRNLRCEQCGLDYVAPEPRLLSFNSPLGACPTCEGFGNIIDIDMDLVVPDRNKSIREGAIAPWNTPAYSHELDELIALANDFGIPLDVPFNQLGPDALRFIRAGVAEREFGGLDGFFRWLERRKYKMHLRVFLSRWRSATPCPDCHGDRLRPESLAIRLGGTNIAEFVRLEVREARRTLNSLVLDDWQRDVAAMMLQQIAARLGYMESVGLGYLTLDRPIRTLSGGEAQRVALTSALGSSLVNMLYVLDEPTAGLHPGDVDRLIETISGLRDRRNTVVVVEHEESMLRAADQLIEFGPGAGERGGKVVFQGNLSAMESSDRSITGDYLFGRRGLSLPGRRRETNRGRITLKGATGNNLQNLSVDFPLSLLCLVTGVSGSGKSTLVQDTLYGALCRQKRKKGPLPYPYDDLHGAGQIDDVVLVDQSPIGRSPRSNPVTFIKAFDAIRAVFANTVEARTHNYTAGYFSFNVEGGRCSACKGNGAIKIDMQFLADVYMTCQQCHGTRYRKEILKVLYRGRNIADVLSMTVREAFAFFRGQIKVQAKLKQLLDVGLDYLRLGQPANTLSAGEAQRLKLASYMSAASRRRTLFILDEPTTGLHFADVVKLLDCFDALLNVGHSLILVEHSLQMMKAADYIIDLGPGAATEGGRVVAAGTPEEIAAESASMTGRFLAREFTRQKEHHRMLEQDTDNS